jgi:hypothetical protein
MEVIDDQGEIGLSEVLGPETGIECRETKVDRISTGSDCGLQAFPVPGRG